MFKNQRWLVVALGAFGLSGCVGPTEQPVQLEPPILKMRRGPAGPKDIPAGKVAAHYATIEVPNPSHVIPRDEFIKSTAELNSFGKDHILEIAARARSAEFPILIERPENNSDPELDQHRRQVVSWILSEMDVQNANQRVVVSQTPHADGP